MIRILYVTDAPHDGKASNTYMQRTQEAIAAYAGVDLEVRIVPAVPVAQPQGKAPPLATLRQHRQDLLDEIVAWNPDHVVSLGSAALQALTGTATTMRKHHGRMRWLGIGPTLRFPWTPALAPFQVVRNSDLHRDMVNVLYKVMTQKEPLPPLDVDYTLCLDRDALAESLEYLADASVVGVDVETTGLSQYRDTILALGIGAVSTDGLGGYACVVPWQLLADPLACDMIADAVWSRDRRAVGHNFKFDMQFIAQHLGWAPHGARTGDTLLLAHLLDERPNSPGSRARGSGLKDLVAQRYDFDYGFDFKDFYEQPDEAKDWDAMHAYLGFDVTYTAKLWTDLELEASQEGSDVMRVHEDLLVPVSRAIAEAEHRGAPIDVDWVRKRVGQLDARIARATHRLEVTLPRLAITTPVTNVLSPTQIADVFYGEWGWTPDVRKHGKVQQDDRSTDKAHLEAAVAKYSKSRDPLQRRRARWAHALGRLRKDVKTRSTYTGSILDKVDDDGRIRASFLLHGASTGRLSSQGPNLQNIPAVDREGADKVNPMRRAFRPRGENLWVEVDYSQLELRVAAALSQDQAFGDVFRNKRDVHMEVAVAIFGRPADKILKAERFLAKSVSFGIIYGRSAKALAGGAEMAYAERELGMIPWTEEQAQKFINKFLRSYPGLRDWISDLHATVPVQGYVDSAFGRRRRFPLFPASKSELGGIQRQAVNTPVQSAASDLCIQALAMISDRIEHEGLESRVLFPVHDSICLEAVPDEIVRVEEICREVMEIDFMNVPLTVDFEYGPTWADVKAH